MPVNPPSTPAAYENVEVVLNLARSLVNDTFAGATNTPGEGRIFIDTAPFIIPLYNNAIRHLQRDLETRVPGFRSTITEVIINNIPPVNGPQGLGTPDPSILCSLSYAGYWDGSTTHGAFSLPTALLVPLKLWNRVSGEQNNFGEIKEDPDGLDMHSQGTNSIGRWEWRGDAIYFQGCTNNVDLRLRYISAPGLLSITTNPATFPNIACPWMDSSEALAYHMAFEFCQSQLPTGQAIDLLSGYRTAMTQLVARYVRQAQSIQFRSHSYGTGGDLFNW